MSHSVLKNNDHSFHSKPTLGNWYMKLNNTKKYIYCWLEKLTFIRQDSCGRIQDKVVAEYTLSFLEKTMYKGNSDQSSLNWMVIPFKFGGSSEIHIP